MTGSPISLLLLAIIVLLLPGRIAARERFRRMFDPGTTVSISVRCGRAVADPFATASVFDLLAACLRAGLPIAVAARTVAPTAPQPLATALRRAADLLALGADPVTAWEQASGDTAIEAVASLARMARRSARSGASLAIAIAELAQQYRAAAGDVAVARAERAGVLISGPLGLCFLPAFICLGIVPVVTGLAGHVLGGGLL